MAAIVFPSSPTLNQVFSANGTTWIWDGTSWNAFTPAPSVAWTAGTLDSGDASGNNGVATSTSTTAHGLPSPIANNGAFITSNGKQWVLGSVTPTFASGTALLFQQTAAPTGWTKVTAHDNKALRLVSGTVGSGGSVAFTTAFASGLSADATTLATTQIPAHLHSNSPPWAGRVGVSGGATPGVFSDGGGWNTTNTGGGGSHAHTLPSFAVSYVDVIIATKD